MCTVSVVYVHSLFSPVACKPFSGSAEGGTGSGKSPIDISTLHAERTPELPNVYHNCHNEGLV